jgi:predicted dehydrogenase
MDLGVYGLSMAHHLLGPPERVAVEAIRSEGGSIRDVAVLMRHRGGALSSVRASHATSLGNGLEIAGARGRLAVEAPFIQATRARLVPLRAGGRGPGAPTGRAERIKDLVRATPLWPAARALAARARGGGGRTIEAGFRGYGLRFEAEEVARCLAAGRAESALMPLDDTVAVLETADRIRAALEG